MNKRIHITVAAVLLAAASTTALADDGAFFVNGNLGQSRYHDSGFNDKTDTAGAVRLGYDWNAGAFSFGAEGGYVDLGKASGLVYVPYYGGPYGGAYGISAKTSGWLLGGNFKYRFGNNMYLSTRAGWFRSTFDTNVSGLGSQSYSGNGGYVGLGLGYDFNRNFGVGASYDRYHGRATIYGEKVGENIDMFSAFVEFRF